MLALQLRGVNPAVAHYAPISIEASSTVLLVSFSDFDMLG
jgi:hypothetical protein